MKKVSGPQVVTTAEAPELPLPAEIQEALGELVGAAREGLLALSVGLGLTVVHQLMEREVDEVVGPKGKHDPDRTAKRHGHEDGSMTLGGRRVPVSRPRMRTADDEHEVPVASYEYFADRDPLTRAVMDRMLAGVSTRKYQVVGEPVGEEVDQESSSTSKSTVSELFIERTRTALGELMARRLDDVRLAVMMLDGLETADRTHVVALGITTEGVKIPLGLWEGSTENATLVSMLLADLVDRGLDPEQAILFVIDGGKALRRGIKDVFGEHALVHRCHRHKERNVCDLLPERDRPQIIARIRGAWALTNPLLAEERLELLASELDRTWPDAARLAARRDAGHANADAARDRRAARQDAVLHEPVRIDDRNRPLHAAQRETLAGRRHAQALDRCRDARRRATVPQDHRLPRSRQARDRDRATHHPRCQKEPRPSGDSRARYRLTRQPMRIVTEVPRQSGQPRAATSYAQARSVCWQSLRQPRRSRGLPTIVNSKQSLPATVT
jgi:putative transposase